MGVERESRRKQGRGERKGERKGNREKGEQRKVRLRWERGGRRDTQREYRGRPKKSRRK